MENSIVLKYLEYIRKEYEHSENIDFVIALTIAIELVKANEKGV